MNSPAELPPIVFDAPRCTYITIKPIYAKSVGGHAIDPSEFVNDKGAHIMDQYFPCANVADPGEAYCPYHKVLVENEVTHAPA